MVFRQNYKILFHDADKNGVLYPSRLFVYLQETATMHIAAIGPSSEDMHEKDGEGFWLTRIALEIVEEIHAYDEITVETWGASDSHGFSFTRCFRVLKNGGVVGCAYSVWILMKLSESRPVPVKNWKVGLELEEPIKPSAPIHFIIPFDLELREIGKHRVAYSDIDINGHMNNTRYPNMIFDCLPEQKSFTEFTINYLHECTEGETLSLFCGTDEEEGVCYFRSIKEDGSVNIEARIKLK